MFGANPMPSPDPMAFGPQLKRQRLAAGLTQEALAERAGLSPKAVSDLERDPARTPRLGTVTLLADALGLDAGRRAELLSAARPGSVAGPAAGEAELSRPVMPRPLTPLIGRADAARTVSKLLRQGDTQLLTLTGPGGVGKTRLAIEVADQIAADFADGTVFVDLAPLRDPGLVLGAIAQRLGIDERDATPLPELVTAALRARHLLVLLDNFEHLLPARQTLLALLEACPRVVMLVTSRVSLRVRGGRDYPIAPLALPETVSPPETLPDSPAVKLFVERAYATGTELAFDAETLTAVAEICCRLDGLPLAIELAAARVPVLPPPALLARLGRRLPVLVAGPHDLPARQKTMRDAIAWSYELLAGWEQAQFRRLCVFAGGCTLEAAEAVCGEDGEGRVALDGFATLVGSSLLQVENTPTSADPSRVTMLETIREYGLERLAALGEAGAVRARHAAYYLDMAERAAPALTGPEAGAWLARLDREHDNLRAVLRWARDRGEGAIGLRLARSLWRFWALRGHLSEGRRWLREALDHSAEADAAAPSARIGVLIGAARLATAQAAYDEAAARCAEAVAAAQEEEEPQDLVAALNAQALLAREQDRYSDAAGIHEAALSLARASCDRAGEAAALLGLAFAALFTGDATRASVLAEQSLAVARELGDRDVLARALVLLAWTAVNSGASERAEALGTEALDLFRSLGDTGEHAEALFFLGTVAVFAGNYGRAASLFEESLAQRRDRGDEHGTTRALGGLGSALLNLGDLTRAHAVLAESLVVARRYEDRWGSAMSLTLLGHTELAEGQVTRAQARFAEAASFFQEIGNLMFLPWCLEGLAEVAAARGHYTRAAELDAGRETVRAQVGALLPPVHPAAYTRTLAAVRDGLTREALDAARASASHWSPQQIIAAALGEV
jgi:predicted ATPase/transcriptional regulator with XRE-family HTH domain